MRGGNNRNKQAFLFEVTITGKGGNLRPGTSSDSLIRDGFDKIAWWWVFVRAGPIQSCWQSWRDLDSCKFCKSSICFCFSVSFALTAYNDSTSFSVHPGESNNCSVFEVRWGCAVVSSHTVSKCTDSSFRQIASDVVFSSIYASNLFSN